MAYYSVGKIHDTRAYTKRPEPPRTDSKTSKGLGDTVEKIIAWTGLDKIVGKKDCGCKKRKEMLNKLVPYDQK